VRMSGDVTFATAVLGHLYGTAGKVSEARSVCEEMKAKAARTYVPAYDIALVCIGLGWNDEALDYLAKAHRERSGWITYLKVDPRLDPVRGDVRFVNLLRHVRLAT
jgi:hypothetical protein